MSTAFRRLIVTTLLASSMLCAFPALSTELPAQVTSLLEQCLAKSDDMPAGAINALQELVDRNDPAIRDLFAREAIRVGGGGDQGSAFKKLVYDAVDRRQFKLSEQLAAQVADEMGEGVEMVIRTGSSGTRHMQLNGKATGEVRYDFLVSDDDISFLGPRAEEAAKRFNDLKQARGLGKARVKAFSLSSITDPTSYDLLVQQIRDPDAFVGAAGFGKIRQEIVEKGGAVIMTRQAGNLVPIAETVQDYVSRNAGSTLAEIMDVAAIASDLKKFGPLTMYASAIRQMGHAGVTEREKVKYLLRIYASMQAAGSFGEAASFGGRQVSYFSELGEQMMAAYKDKTGKAAQALLRRHDLLQIQLDAFESVMLSTTRKLQVMVAQAEREAGRGAVNIARHPELRRMIHELAAGFSLLHQTGHSRVIQDVIPGILKALGSEGGREASLLYKVLYTAAFDAATLSAEAAEQGVVRGVSTWTRARTPAGLIEGMAEAGQNGRQARLLLAEVGSERLPGKAADGARELQRIINESNGDTFLWKMLSSQTAQKFLIEGVALAPFAAWTMYQEWSRGEMKDLHDAAFILIDFVPGGMTTKKLGTEGLTPGTVLTFAKEALYFTPAWPFVLSGDVLYLSWTVGGAVQLQYESEGLVDLLTYNGEFDDEAGRPVLKRLALPGGTTVDRQEIEPWLFSTKAVRVKHTLSGLEYYVNNLSDKANRVLDNQFMANDPGIQQMRLAVEQHLNAINWDEAARYFQQANVGMALGAYLNYLAGFEFVVNADKGKPWARLYEDLKTKMEGRRDVVAKEHMVPQLIQLAEQKRATLDAAKDLAEELARLQQTFERMRGSALGKDLDLVKKVTAGADAASAKLSNATAEDRQLAAGKYWQDALASYRRILEISETIVPAIVDRTGYTQAKPLGFTWTGDPAEDLRKAEQSKAGFAADLARATRDVREIKGSEPKLDDNVDRQALGLVAEVAFPWRNALDSQDKAEPSGASFDKEYEAALDKVRALYAASGDLQARVEKGTRIEAGQNVMPLDKAVVFKLMVDDAQLRRAIADGSLGLKWSTEPGCTLRPRDDRDEVNITCFQPEPVTVTLTFERRSPVAKATSRLTLAVSIPDNLFQLSVSPDTVKAGGRLSASADMDARLLGSRFHYRWTCSNCQVDAADRASVAVTAPGSEGSGIVEVEVLIEDKAGRTSRLANKRASFRVTAADGKDGDKDGKADPNLAANIDAALKARDWRRLSTMLDELRKSDLRIKNPEAYKAADEAITAALEKLKDERMKWALAWKGYIEALDAVDSRTWDVLTREVDRKRDQTEQHCYETASSSEDPNKRVARCKKVASDFYESCLGDLPDRHFEERRRIRVAYEQLPDAVHQLHSAGFATHKAWFEKVEEIAKTHGLTFPYPDPVVPRLQYTSSCAAPDLPKGTRQLRVTVRAPEATLPPGQSATVSVVVEGGKPPYRYSWSGAAGSGEQATVAPRWAGDWTLIVEVTDADGKTGEGSATVRAAPAKFALAGLPGQVFYGSRTTFGVQGQEAPPAAPVADPCAGRPRSNSPFDPCNQIEVDPNLAVSVSGSSTAPAPTIIAPATAEPVPKTSAAAASGRRYVWQAEPGVTFDPATGTDPRTTVTWDRMGQVKVWCEVHEQREGAFHTIGECDQETVNVVAPAFSLQFDPPSGQGRIGQEVKAQIVANPEVPAKLIDYRWLEPATSNRREATDNASEIGFVPKDAKPVALKALARVPFHGDDIATIDASYAAASYSVTVSVEERGPKPVTWDPVKGGLVPVPKGTYAADEQIGLRAALEGEPKPAEVRWRWTVNDGTTIGNPISQTPTVSRHEPGAISATVEALDRDGNVLGRGSVSLSVTVSADAVGNAKAKAEAAKLVGKANAAWVGKDPSKALALIEKAQKLDPKDAEIGRLVNEYRDGKARFDRAATLREEGGRLQNAKKLTEAIDRFKQAQALWPDPKLAEHIAKIEAALAKEREAEAKAKALREEATRLAQAGKLDEAIAKVEESQRVRATPEAEQQLRDLKTARDRKKAEEAQKQARAKALRDEGAALQAKGDLAGALTKFKEAQQLLPDPKLAEHIAKVEAALKERQALIDQAEALRRNPQAIGCGKGLGEATALADRLQKVDAGKAAVLRKDVATVAMAAASNLVANQLDFAKGIPCLEVAQKLDPANAQIGQELDRARQIQVGWRELQALSPRMDAAAAQGRILEADQIRSRAPELARGIDQAPPARDLLASLVAKWDRAMAVYRAHRDSLMAELQAMLDGRRYQELIARGDAELAREWYPGDAQLIREFQSHAREKMAYEASQKAPQVPTAPVATPVGTAPPAVAGQGPVTGQPEGGTTSTGTQTPPVPAGGLATVTNEPASSTTAGAAGTTGVQGGAGSVRIEACIDGSDWLRIESGRLVHEHRAFAQIGTHPDCPASHAVAGGGLLVNGQRVSLGQLPYGVGIASLGSFELEKGRGSAKLDGSKGLLLDDDGPGGPSIYVVRLYGGATAAPPAATPPKPPAPKRAQVGNIGGVTNGPTVPTTFTFSEPVRLVWLQTYHWNHARGAKPGRIGLRHQDGTVYGPWQSRGLPGQGGVPNAYWRAEPGVVLKPGTYTVTDSDPATWATNAQAGNKGFADLEVVPVGAAGDAATPTPPTAAPAPKRAQVGNIGGVTNGPTAPTTFTFSEPVRLVWLQTYHWNHARGAKPGRIGLRHQDGTMYGPWQSRGLPGQGGVPNAYWRAEPGVVLKPGTYTVTDSDPATWATNAQAGNKGFADLEVVPATDAVTTTPPTDVAAPAPADAATPVTPPAAAVPASTTALTGRWEAHCDGNDEIYPVTIRQEGSRLRVVVEGQAEYQGTLDGESLTGASADGLTRFDGTVVSPAELRLDWEGRASADGPVHLNSCTFRRKGPPPAEAVSAPPTAPPVPSTMPPTATSQGAPSASGTGGTVPCKRGGSNPFEEDICIEVDKMVPVAPR